MEYLKQKAGPILYISCALIAVGFIYWFGAVVGVEGGYGDR